MFNVDQSRAFNVIPHVILINKLRKVNIGEIILKMIKSYLDGRTCVGGHVLGRLMFLMERQKVQFLDHVCNQLDKLMLDVTLNLLNNAYESYIIVMIN